MTIDRERLAALGYRVIDGKNDVVQSGWLAIPPGKPPTVGIGATEDDAWQWAAQHAEENRKPADDPDIAFAILACRLTGWEGVARRLEQGWKPDGDTNEGKLVELAARHRQSNEAARSLEPK